MNGNEKGHSQSERLSEALLKLYDDMAEFTDCCAFICAAFAALAEEEGALDASTREGIRCLSSWMRERMTELKEELATIRAWL